MCVNFASKVNALAVSGKPFFFIIDFDKKMPEVFPIDQLPDDIRFFVPGFQNYPSQSVHRKDFWFRAFPPSFETYNKAFNEVLKEINIGNSYLLNLTFKSKIETNLSLNDIFLRSKAKYKLWFRDRFVVFSPETFVQIIGGKISSFPMKGTIDANIPDAKNVLLSDEKETAEHHTIMDLIRNDLAIVAEDVYVEKFKHIEKLITNKGDLLQMSSKITGRLPENYLENLGDILLDLLPAGSISGAPKQKTVQIIKAVEDYNRGYYAGVFGYFDGKNLDSAVMIRFIEKEGDELYFKSGGGVTSMSDVQKEYEELIQKIYVPIY